jgi:hypothetical protein
MLRLESLPAASWKAHLGAAAMVALCASVAVQQWPDLYSDLAIVRWAAWFFLVGSCLNLPGLLVVCLLDRLPEAWQRWPRRLPETLPEIRAEIAQEQRKRREGLRILRA